MTLSPGAKVQPNLSTLRSPAGFNAACSSMLRERAPTPPRFIGQRTWTSRIGSRPKRRGMRVLTSLMMRETAVHMYRGTTMAGIIMDEARHDPKRGFSGGYEMETLSLGLPFMAPGR